MGVVTLLLLIFSGVTAAVAALAAWFALIRHFGQTNADRQRRITEGFSKAVEQLGSDKLEVRLGGIYSLERISRESPDDYWTVMENLTAFVRERSRRNEAERTSQDADQRIRNRAYDLWQKAGRPHGFAERFWNLADRHERFAGPAADILAVLMVIGRRSDAEKTREGMNGWQFDFTGAILRRCDLQSADLKRANFSNAYLETAKLCGASLDRANFDDANIQETDFLGAHLEDAHFVSAYGEWAIFSHGHLGAAKFNKAYLKGTVFLDADLNGADLSEANLESAVLSLAHLREARFYNAHLEGADISNASLEGANLYGAHLERAYLRGTHLERADLSRAVGLLEAQLRDAHGDAETKLPEGLARPAHWEREGRERAGALADTAPGPADVAENRARRVGDSGG
jgi:uncharacterized protein YjbI with pentapeptide repeats